MKYKNTTIIEIAQKQGSKSKTREGAWKYLLANLPKPNLPRKSSKYNWDAYNESRRNRTGDGRARALGYDPNDPNTPGRIMDQAIAENRLWDERCRIEIKRDQYGAFCETRYGNPQARPNTLWFDARDLLVEAVKQKIIPFAFDRIGFDHKGRADGNALHHEIYDYAPNALIVCLRATDGTRYGVKTLSKIYMMITRKNDKITAVETSEPIAKLAKFGAAPGTIIARILGLPNGATLKTAPMRWEIAYKALAKVEDKLCSIYSGEEYKIGELKRERAQKEHGGGYYCYPTIDDAQKCDVPENSRYIDKPRAIVKCAVAGNKIEYGNGKSSRTYLQPIEIVAQ